MIAPDHATAHYAVGVVLTFTNRAAEGVAALERALALNRNLVAAHGMLGAAKTYVGRSEETEAHVLATALTDAVYVFFNAAVSARRRFAAATWSSVWYLLAAFAVISYTSKWAYVLFTALGSWIGLSITALDRVAPLRRE